MTETRFTPKQAIFIEEYLVDGNGARAAMAAGVPEASAKVTASRWLKSSKVAAVVSQRQAQRAAKLDITAERVLEELAKLAYYDPGRLFDADGKMKPVHLLDDVTRAAVSQVDVEETETSEGKDEARVVIRSRTKKVKMADKGQNLERLGRHLKLFTDRLDLSGRLTLEDLVCSDDRKTERGAEEAA